MPKSSSVGISPANPNQFSTSAATQTQSSDSSLEPPVGSIDITEIEPASELEGRSGSPPSAHPSNNSKQAGDGTRKAALLVTASTALSSLIGIVNALLSARYFGVSDAMDAYLAALLVPQLLGFICGIRLSVFLVPWLITLRHIHGTQQARRIQNRLLFWLTAGTATVLIAYYFWARTGLLLFDRSAIEWLVPGFDARKQDLVITLSKWTVPGGICVVYLSILTSIAHSHQRFQGAAVATIINPVMTFLFLIFCYSYLGVSALAAGFFFGPLLSLLPVWWSLRGADEEMIPAVKDTTATLPTFASVFLLGLVTTVHNQIPLFVSRNIASSMDSGVIAGLQYASQFSWMPVTILATSVGTALLPSLSKKHQSSRDGFDTAALYQASKAIRVLAYILVPLAVLSLVFAFQMVSMILARGNFDRQAVELTYQSLRCYAPLFWISALWAIVLKIVQAQNALRTLAEALLLGTTVDVTLMLTLHHIFGYKIIPVASSTNYIVVTLYLLVRTRHSIRLPMREIMMSMVILTALAFAAAGVTALVRDWTPAVLTGLTFVVVYGGLNYAFNVSEQREFWSLIIGRGLSKFRKA